MALQHGSWALTAWLLGSSSSPTRLASFCTLDSNFCTARSSTSAVSCIISAHVGEIIFEFKNFTQLEARREEAAILLVQTPALSASLSLARFSVFPFWPSNLGLFGASLQTHAPQTKRKHSVTSYEQFQFIVENYTEF